MYITDKYVFIHMDKCAGVFVKDFMLKYMDAKVCKYKHAPIRMLPEKHENKIKFGVIRNPFSWYVSFYKYLRQAGHLKGITFDKFVRDYTEHPRALLSLKGKVLRKFENLMPPRTELEIGAWTFFHYNYFHFQAIDIFKSESSFEIFRLSEENSLDKILRTETLRDDLCLLFGLGYLNELDKWKPRNVSQNQKPYQEWYTKETRAMVQERDGHLMEYYGYGFED